MDRRIIFFIVFALTILSTVLVASVSLLAGQTVIRTVLYSLVTMWLMGITSQMLLQTLYRNIVRDLEDERDRATEDQADIDISLDDIEEIEQVEEMKSGGAPEADTPPVVGSSVGRNVERTG